MHGGGCMVVGAWQGACVAGVHAWQGCVCGRGHAWRGVCMAGKTAIAAGGTHSTGMHSYSHCTGPFVTIMKGIRVGIHRVVKERFSL